MLNELLTSEEILELRELSKHREWVILLRLFERLEIQYYRELSSFKDSNDAYEKRGKVEGIRKVRELIKSLYDTRNLIQNDSGRNRSSEIRSGTSGSGEIGEREIGY